MQISRSVRYFLFALLLLIISASSFAGVFVSVTVAPPVMPVYAQPPCPGDGYIWTPGYWAYGPDGYYWVPGTWVMPPTVGVLWTPGYWGWNEGVYVWHAGYWGPHIGFYGGVNYGYGYFGNGYDGGYWRGRTFFYNRSVNNVTINSVHIYNKTVINNVNVNRVSYNGGRGGINARPTREQEGWARERHFEPTRMQTQHEHAAGGNRESYASQNHGRPPVAATARPGEFHGRDAVNNGWRNSGRPAEDRSMSRRPNSTVERPVAGQGPRGERGGRPEYNNTRWESGSRPNAGHQENGRSHEESPRRENGSHSDRGHDQKPH